MSIYLGNTGTSPISIYKGSQAITAVYVGENKVWSTTDITKVDYIETDGNCWLNIGPLLTETSIVAGSFYQPLGYDDTHVFWGSNGYGAFVYYSNAYRVRAETLYENGGTRYDSNYNNASTSLPFYLIKQIFGGQSGYTAYAEQTSSPYLYSSLSHYLENNPSSRLLHVVSIEGRTFDSTQDVFVMKGVKNARLSSGARCFGFRMWDNGIATFDGVPATDGTDYGLYDRVSGTFFINAGTVTMTGGNL